MPNRPFILLLLFFLPLLTVAQSPCGSKLKEADEQKIEEVRRSYEAKEYDRCAVAVSRLVKRLPRNAEAHFYAGLVAVHRNDAKNIRKHFGKVLSLCPDYPDARAYLYQGIIRYSDDDFDGAVESLNRFFDTVNLHSSPAYDALYAEASNYLHWAQFLADAHRNQAPFAPRVMLGVSSRYEELMPYLTPDGQEMYYIRFLPEESGSTFYQREMVQTFPRLCMSRWKDTTFSEGTVLPAPFNSHESEGGITMTADGRTLFLSAMQRTRKGYNNFDIFSSTLRDGVWQPFVPVAAVNGDATWESHPSVTPDGQFLYFASNRPGGQGGIDIWRCRRLPNGDWSRPENLGPTVNTPGNEKCPFIHADGHTLYFASNGWQGFGGYDTYFTDLADPTGTIPTNLGLPINTEKDDICFGVAADGTTAYYAGKHPERGLGGRDILSFELYATARPEPMQLTTGHIVSDRGTPLAAQLHLNRVGSPDACYLVDGTDGRFSVLLSQRESNLVWVESDGFLPWAAIVAPRGGASLPQRIALQPAKVGSRTPLAIAATGDNLSPDDRRVLDVYADFLLQHPTMTATIETPHAATARAVHDYLVSRKLRPSRLKQRSGGDIPSPHLVITQQ